MKRLIIVLLISVPFLCLGQQTEKMKIFYDWGKTQLKEVYYVIVDTPTKHGPYKSYWRNGKPQAEATYNNGKLEGLNKQWEDNGDLTFEVNWSNGIRQGITTEWDWYDNLTRRSVPIEKKKLYEKGKLIEIEEFVNGEKIGKAWYNEDGLTTGKFEKIYKDGKVGVYESFGWAKEYYPTGEMSMEFECCSFTYRGAPIKPVGVMRAYYKSGNLKVYKIVDQYQEQFVYKEFDDVESDEAKNLLSNRHSLLFVSENDLFHYLENEVDSPPTIDIPTTISELSLEEKVFLEALIDAPAHIYVNLSKEFSNSAWSDKDRIIAIINMAKSTNKHEFDRSKGFVTLESYPTGQPKKVYKGSDFSEYKGTRFCIEYYEDGNIASKYSEVYGRFDYQDKYIHQYGNVINYHPNEKVSSYGFIKFEKICERSYAKQGNYYIEKDGVWKYFNEDGTLKEAELYIQVKVLNKGSMCGYSFKTDKTLMNPSEYLTYLEKNKKSEYKQLVGKDKVLKKDISTFLDNLRDVNSTSNINILIKFYENLNKMKLISTSELLEKIHGKSDKEIIKNLNISL